MNIEFTLSGLGENTESGDVVSVLVREGDVIASNDSVIEVETDKAVVEIPCPQAGKVAKVHVIKGQTIKVGQPVLTIEVDEPAKPQPAIGPAQPEEAAAASAGADRLHAGPTGEGPELAGIPAQRGTREPAIPPGELGQDAYGPVRRQRMSRIRQTIAAQMVKSASMIPHVTNFDDADVTELGRMRKTIPPAYLGPMVKLTATPFVIKAAALALRQHPVLNASLDEAKQEIIYKQYVNLGVAVDTPRGLVVPVIRNVDQMGVLQIARELMLLAARARSAKFTLDELRGGTFTISNLGAVGGIYSTPIINHPEVAILLLGRSRWQLGIHEGKIEGRLMLPLSLSYDHRVVDGAAAGRFLNDVIDYLQSPGKLLLTK
jgi:pyruvate dehydrogenase E2 component (dihydrolipoamide acetyltransferase)